MASTFFVQTNGFGFALFSRIYSSTLRHSFATHLMEDGADTRLVQEKLRHQKLDMVLRYTHVARKRQQEASDKTFQRSESDV